MIDETIAGPKSHITDHTSLSLLERVRGNDELAWRRLVDLYGPLIFSWCRREGLRAEDARDLTQEVFATVAKDIERFRRENDGDTFRGWLRGITRNRLLMFFRNRGGQAQAAGGTEAHVRLEQIADKLLEESEETDEEEKSGLYKRIMELVRNEFEERTWKAFVQTTIDGRSSVDVAADLQMTPGAVRQAKYKVLRRLRAELCDPLE